MERSCHRQVIDLAWVRECGLTSPRTTFSLLLTCNCYNTGLLPVALQQALRGVQGARHVEQLVLDETCFEGDLHNEAHIAEAIQPLALLVHDESVVKMKGLVECDEMAIGRRYYNRWQRI